VVVNISNARNSRSNESLVVGNVHLVFVVSRKVKYAINRPLTFKMTGVIKIYLFSYWKVSINPD